MATEVDKLLVRVEADLGDLKKGLKDLDQTLKDSQQKSQSAFGKIATVAKAALGAVVVAQTARAALALTNFVSHVEEAQAKSSVVFGEFTGDVRKQLQQFGDEVGRSAFALEEMASKVQDTFVPMGFARGEAAQLSVQLAKLATDVASFNNASDAETMEAFQSALVGNHETVRRFGIVITEATLNQELLRMGLTKTSQTASNAEKVQARLNLIMAGTTDAHGDAARTADSFANQSKALQAALERLAVEALNPLMDDFAGFVGVLTDATNGVREFLKEVGIIPKDLNSIAEITADIAKAEAVLNKQMRTRGKVDQDLAKRIKAEKELQALLIRKADIQKFEFLTRQQNEKKAAEAEKNKKTEVSAKAQGDATKEIDKLRNANKLLQDELNGVGSIQLAVNEALQKHSEAGDEDKQTIADLTREQELLKGSLQNKVDVEKEAEAIAQRKKDLDEEYIDTLSRLNDEITLLGLEQSGATEKEIEAMKVRLENKGLSEEQIEVLIALKNVELELGEAIEKTTEAEKAKSDSIKSAKDIVDGLLPKEMQLLQLQEDLKVAFAEGAITEAEFRAGMADLQHQMEMLDPVFAEMVNGANRAADALADSLAEGVMQGKLSLDSFSNIAKSFVKGLIAEFIKTYVIKKLMASAFSFMGFPSAGAALGSAGGGSIHPSQPRVVGERGPELFVPHSAGNILNNSSSRSALGGGPQVVVNQTLQVETGVAQTVRAEMASLMPVIKEQTINAVIESKVRGGAVSSAFGG